MSNASMVTTYPRSQPISNRPDASGLENRIHLYSIHKLMKSQLAPVKFIKVIYMYVLRFVGLTQGGIEITFRTDCADLYEKLYPIVRQSSQAPHYTTPSMDCRLEVHLGQINMFDINLLISVREEPRVNCYKMKTTRHFSIIKIPSPVTSSSQMTYRSN